MFKTYFIFPSILMWITKFKLISIELISLSSASLLIRQSWCIAKRVAASNFLWQTPEIAP